MGSASGPQVEDRRAALSVTELADRWGTHPETIRRRIWAGDCPAFRVGGTGPWRIPVTWVEAQEAA